jgi:hypothetical protein
VAVVEVGTVSHHTRLMTAHDGKLRLYPGDRLVVVFGNRYATDAFEACLDGVEQLHMLTDAGMVGTVRCQHHRLGTPTRLKFLGYLADVDGERINLKLRQFHPVPAQELPRNTIVVIGSGMNSGKTTTAAKLTRALVQRGLRVAACKVTGSVSYRDLAELRSTGAQDVRDFSCYGFPSTYLAAKHEVLRLFHTMRADAQRSQPDLMIMEVADGVLQRETRMLLGDSSVKRTLLGVLLTATCAPSALFSVGQLERLGHQLIGVSGCITSAPLSVRELTCRAGIPVASSAGPGAGLADLVLRHRALSRWARSAAAVERRRPHGVDRVRPRSAVVRVARPPALVPGCAA